MQCKSRNRRLDSMGVLHDSRVFAAGSNQVQAAVEHSSGYVFDLRRGFVYRRESEQESQRNC